MRVWYTRINQRNSRSFSLSPSKKAAKFLSPALLSVGNVQVPDSGSRNDGFSGSWKLEKDVDDKKGGREEGQLDGEIRRGIDFGECEGGDDKSQKFRK